MKEGNARARRCAVRLSEREYAALRSAADASGCTMSDLMRSVAVASVLAGPGEGRRVIAYDRAEMSRLAYQVRALGLQYNQALRALNTLAKRDWVDPSAGNAALREIAALLSAVEGDRAATLAEVRRMAEADRMLIGR